MHKIEKFSYAGTEYEIRALPYTDGWRAAVFVNNVKHGPTFSVSHEDDMDCAFYAGERGLDSLFRIIKEEVRQGRIGKSSDGSGAS